MERQLTIIVDYLRCIPLGLLTAQKNIYDHWENLIDDFHKANKLLSDAVARRKSEFPEQSEFLTNWQVHSANLVMSAISVKAIDNGMGEGARELPVIHLLPVKEGLPTRASWKVFLKILFFVFDTQIR